jgi:hypothetical protein
VERHLDKLYELKFGQVSHTADGVLGFPTAQSHQPVLDVRGLFASVCVKVLDGVRIRALHRFFQEERFPKLLGPSKRDRGNNMRLNVCAMLKKSLRGKSRNIVIPDRILKFQNFVDGRSSVRNRFCLAHGMSRIPQETQSTLQ